MNNFRSVLKMVIVVNLILIVCSPTSADLCLHCYQKPKIVKIVFPDGKIEKVSVGFKEIKRHFKRKKIPKNLYHSSHKIDTYVYTAFFILELKFDGRIEMVPKPKKYEPTKKVWITQIDHIKNGPEGTWTLYINGTKSKANINTIVNDCSVRNITFKFENNA